MKAPATLVRRPRSPKQDGHAPNLLLRNGVQLDQALLDLHAVQEIEEFWRTARRAAHAALPLDFICLCLRPFALMPSTVFRERAPFASDEEFKLFQELSPLSPHLAAHAGVTVVRMSDVIAEPALVKSAFFRRFMNPYRERYFACLCFWHDGTFQGMLGMHRTLEQGDFAPTEMALLKWLHSHFDTVVQRILDWHRERAVRLSLEKLLGALPIATLLLDWDLKVAYRNRSGIELCGQWNLGPERARVENCTTAFRVPSEIVDYCAEFKSHWNPCHHRNSPLIAPGGAWISHPEIPGLRATINLLQLDAAPLSMPVFMVRLERLALNGHAPEEANGALTQLSRLSLREREVAGLAAQGWTNDEIARRLHKSVLTVKKQMRSIYEKLGIKNRGRLIALLR